MIQPIALPAACAARYKPERLLASGGFGAVYLAEQVDLARRVAVKVLHVEALADREALFRFKDEARMTAAISHPNVVVILDHGVDEGMPWIVYELLAGPTLRTIVDGGALDWRDAAQVGIQVAGALEEAHSRGIVHRDIKPENVIQAAPGLFKVTDFGLAKWSQDQGIQTRTGLVMGTPAYIPPEQIRGDAPGPAGDIYSLGIMLYELATRHVPFESPSPTAVLEMHLNAPPPPMQRWGVEVPRPFERVVARCLAKREADRPTSARGLLEALQALAQPAQAMTVRLEGRPRAAGTGGAGALLRRARWAGVAAAALLSGVAAVLVARSLVSGGALVSTVAPTGARPIVPAMGASVAESSPGAGRTAGPVAGESLESIARHLAPEIETIQGQMGRLMDDLTAGVGALDLEVSSDRARKALPASRASAARIGSLVSALWRAEEDPETIEEPRLVLLTRACGYRLAALCQQRRTERLASIASTTSATDGISQMVFREHEWLNVYGDDELRALGDYSRCSLALTRRLAAEGVNQRWLGQFLGDLALVARTQRSANFARRLQPQAQGVIGRWRAELESMQGKGTMAPVAGVLAGIWILTQPHPPPEGARLWKVTRADVGILQRMAPSAAADLGRLMADLERLDGGASVPRSGGTSAPAR